MKKFVCLLLVVVLVFSFSACGIEEKPTSNTETLSNTETSGNTETSSKTNSDSSSNSVSLNETPFDSSTQNPNIDSDVSSSNNTETSSSKSYQILPGITDMTQEELRPNFWLGNNKKLSDDVLVVILFIDDNIDCAVFQSGKDELVSWHSVKYLENKPYIAVNKLKKSGHYYYDKADWDFLLCEFEKMISTNADL